MKRAVLYARVSTVDQHLETQLLDLRETAKLRGYEITREYTNTISGAKSRRPGLDQLMEDARRRRFDVVLVAAFDRVARNVRHFLEVLDELNHLGVEFVSSLLWHKPYPIGCEQTSSVEHEWHISLIVLHCGDSWLMYGGRACCGLISLGCEIGPAEDQTHV